MQAELKSLDLDPDPASLPGDPGRFVLLARMSVGPTDGPGEESYEISVCTPEWLALACRREGGFYHQRHLLVVDFQTFTTFALRRWLASRVREVRADTWAEIAQRLARFGYWEYEDYSG